MHCAIMLINKFYEHYAYTRIVVGVDVLRLPAEGVRVSICSGGSSLFARKAEERKEPA